MASRDEILAAIRAHRLVEQPLPPTDGPWIEYADPLAQFAEVLAFVGGKCEFVDDAAAADRMLRAMPEWSTAKKTISHVPGVGETNVDLESFSDPHTLEDVDFAVFQGEFAVAENAAIWVTDKPLVHRTLPFIAQHTSIVFKAADIVHNMPQAYARIAASGHDFSTPGFGVFISGPSKTADIEQSLVIGAHGARSMTVFCLRNA